MQTRQAALTVVAALLACALATGCGDNDDDTVIITTSTIDVVNDSDFVIVEVYITEIDNPDYGPNLLAGDVLLPGENLLVSRTCDIYDALLIDEFGVECELLDIDTCFNDATFVITNDTCEVFNAAGTRVGQAARDTVSRVESATL